MSAAEDRIDVQGEGEDVAAPSPVSAIPGAIAGERGPAWVRRGASMQAKVQNALALAVVALLGGAFLFWYYSRVAAAPPPVEETRAKAAAQGEMKLPPLGPAPVKTSAPVVNTPLVEPGSPEEEALLAGGPDSGLALAAGPPAGYPPRLCSTAATGRSGAAATARGAGVDSGDGWVCGCGVFGSGRWSGRYARRLAPSSSPGCFEWNRAGVGFGAGGDAAAHALGGGGGWGDAGSTFPVAEGCVHRLHARDRDRLESARHDDLHHRDRRVERGRSGGVARAWHQAGRGDTG